jgi:hypothetical protein
MPMTAPVEESEKQKSMFIVRLRCKLAILCDGLSTS